MKTYDRIFPFLICIFLMWSLYNQYQEDGWTSVFIILAGAFVIFMVFFVGLIAITEYFITKKNKEEA